MMIDVVIPFYNSYELTKNCIDSVISNTKDINYRLILINDNSSDKEIINYIKILENKHDNIMLVSNEQNLGFLKSCNKSFKISQNDIVLLNNDTIVTPNWLSQMCKAAKSRDNIASVTAMSNHSSLTSVPNYCKPGKIPKLLSIDDMHKIISSSTRKLYPVIPIAVGFCMYINRSALDDIGPFDEIFGMGYCEESDWSMRAGKKGYIHVMDDTTFIWHKGRGSLGKGRKKILEQNEKLLIKKHPDYFSHIHRYMNRKTNWLIFWKIKLVVLRLQLKKLINACLSFRKKKIRD